MTMKKRSTNLRPSRKMGTAIIEHDRAVKAVLRQPYSRILIPEADGRFSAEILEFSGCIAQGDSPDDAFANLERAARSWIVACLKDGKEIPAPSVNYGFSGKLVLRLPRDLHRIASRNAERSAVSLNQYIVSSVAARTGADDLYQRMADRLARPTVVVWSPAPEVEPTRFAAIPLPLIETVATTGSVVNTSNG